MLHFFPMLFDWSIFFLCFLSIYFFSDDPSLLLQDYKKRPLFDLWSIYF
jgi:hypothetical protein